MEEPSLKALIERHQGPAVESLLPDELNVLITSFLPWHPSSIRTQSVLFLSKYSSDIRQKYNSHADSAAATSVLVRAFAASTEARLADTHERSTLAALCFLTAFFQVDWQSASAILSRDGVLESVLDTPDIYPSSKDISPAVATLLSQASGHKQCRSFLNSPQVIMWLEKGTRQTTNQNLRAAAAVALVKLSQGSEVDAQSDNLVGSSAASSAPPPHSDSDDRLVALMKDLIVTKEPSSSLALNAVEGLTYLTIQPAVKEMVSSDPILLKSLFAFVPHSRIAPSFPASHAERTTKPIQDTDLGLSYGIAAIISNLCAYKSQLTEEERQIEKLKRMTKLPGSGGKLSANTTDASADSDMFEDNDHVRIRGERLMKAGVANALTSIVKSLRTDGKRQSVALQRTVAKAFLSLVEEKGNRGMILQGGGAKSLLTIIGASLADMQDGSENGKRAIDALDPSDLLAIQALAKISITSPPAAVFGPAQDSYIDAIRPFAVLLTHSSASLLQRFEAVMALTNITSVSPDAAQRVSALHLIPGKGQNGQTVGDIVKSAETLLLDGNIMLRRAATELVCNLVGGAEDSFNYFGGAKSRLQILAALADVEDVPTRLAASGALATVTESPSSCRILASLEMERHRLIPVLVELISPEIALEYREERPADEEAVNTDTHHPGLVHRGVVCVRNIFANLDSKEERRAMSLEAERQGLARALIQLIKLSQDGASDGVVLKPAAEVLRWIVESGVKLPL